MRTTSDILRRTTKAALVMGGAAVALATLTAAPAAAADLPVTIAGDGSGSTTTNPTGSISASTITFTNSGTGTAYVYTLSSNMLTDGGTACGTTNQATTCDITSGSSKTLTVAQAASGMVFVRIGSVSSMPLTLTYDANGGGGGGGGEAPSGGSTVTAPVPVAAALALDVPNGAVCTPGSSVSGHTGQWLTLPSASECTLTSRSSAKLLGWSTSAEFSVAIAQRQVGNGWGTYEQRNEAGQLTAVFIPAGRSAFVSASNTLYPIWSA